MRKIFLSLVVICSFALIKVRAQSWTADNGNGTYSNPLFFDEFSDPDIIRVGEDFYLAGTTMHAMPRFGGIALKRPCQLGVYELLS